MSKSVYKEPRAWLLTLGTFIFVVLWCDLGIEKEKEEIREEITFLEKKISKIKKQSNVGESHAGLPSALDN
ncbi:hypothetical protein Gasu2_50910 [Galdieria sulphuraria]|uniref:Uncharacterized protein n=1 Tax=Galdieria sulphuraria TaxID=130081 RepID=M2X3K7_GALSU|nr:uncharacterized protein Gasu_17620 [Galdieria sulphuraria]EME31000.1 hypothetical protein Gasu_17620 [Galdieria sulphuraria]GJD10928.1 hypothetical protein Gasu2_50910 [Galdieria sulphuraria]|eukprot:XP_005707520.1 hypothetical protein Gasu_17620 [Galdieria sulphuraria]